MQTSTTTSYPITFRWIVKIALLFFGLFGAMDIAITLRSLSGPIYILQILFGLLPVIGIVYCILNRRFFRYTVESNFLTIREGIISKQTRHVPFGVIQNVLLNQDILDRMLGIASITIENASQGATINATASKISFGLPGSFGSMVQIPGLTKQHAMELKNIILQKMKEHPLDDSQSGL